MSKERADLGFADELDDFNPADWAPQTKAKTVSDLPAKAEARKIAEASGFKSRGTRDTWWGRAGRAGTASPHRSQCAVQP